MPYKVNQQQSHFNRDTPYAVTLLYFLLFCTGIVKTCPRVKINLFHKVLKENGCSA